MLTCPDVLAILPAASRRPEVARYAGLHNFAKFSARSYTRTGNEGEPDSPRCFQTRTTRSRVEFELRRKTRLTRRFTDVTPIASSETDSFFFRASSETSIHVRDHKRNNKMKKRTSTISTMIITIIRSLTDGRCCVAISITYKTWTTG